MRNILVSILSVGILGLAIGCDSPKTLMPAPGTGPVEAPKTVAPGILPAAPTNK